MRDTQEIHPWDKQEGETAAAYAAFHVYLNLGAERSLNAAYAARDQNRTKTGPPNRAPGYWRKWSKQNNWPERAAAWDGYQAKQLRDGIADALAEDAGDEGRQVAKRYRGLLDELCDAAAELITKARKRLRELEDSGPAEAQMLKAAGEVLGRANRDLLLIFGSAALGSGGDDEPDTKAAPEPVDLRQAMREPEAIH